MTNLYICSQQLIDAFDMSVPETIVVTYSGILLENGGFVLVRIELKKRTGMRITKVDRNAPQTFVLYDRKKTSIIETVGYHR